MDGIVPALAAVGALSTGIGAYYGIKAAVKVLEVRIAALETLMEAKLAAVHTKVDAFLAGVKSAS